MTKEHHPRLGHTELRAPLAAQHNRTAASAPEPNYAPLPINNDDDLLMLQVEII